MHTSPRLLLDSLKRCPLCEAVNAESSAACFVCGWSGTFKRDAQELQASFNEIVAQCPALAVKPRKRGLIAKLRRMLVAMKNSGTRPAATIRN